MNANFRLYEALELLPSGSLTRAKRAARMYFLVARCFQMLTRAPEPTIKSHIDQNGHILFDADDPVDDLRIYGTSEEGLRSWLEQRYRGHSSY